VRAALRSLAHALARVRPITRAKAALRWVREARDHGDAALWVWGLIVGVAAAYGVILFRLAIQSVQLAAFGEFSEALAGPASALPPLHVVPAPVLCGLAVAGLL
jgi:CIC family chloride channel protein